MFEYDKMTLSADVLRAVAYRRTEHNSMVSQACGIVRKWRILNAVIAIVSALLIVGSISNIVWQNTYIVHVRTDDNMARLLREAEVEQTLHFDYQEFLTRTKPRIPKIIHQIYRNVSIPSAYHRYIKTWVEKNPEYEYWFWDNVSGRQLIESRYPELLQTYDSYCHDLFRSDAMRYVILYEYGGVYIDMDYECLRSLDDLLDERYVHVVQEYGPQAELLYNTNTMILNAWMAAIPYHPFMNFLINNLPLRARCEFHEVLKSTGPLFLYDMKKKYYAITKCDNDLCDINVLPFNLMMPEWDTSPSMMTHIITTCRRPSRLSSAQRRACLHFRRKGFKPTDKIDPKAYATHKFLHIGNVANNYVDRTGYANIKDIVPKVTFPMERRLNDELRRDVQIQQEKSERLIRDETSKRTNLET